MLDLGVGAGRTSWLLRLLTDRYVGLDWSPEMAEACREAFPGLDVRAGDARGLCGFPDGHFALVMFSYNGIDNLDHAGRGQVLAEAARVLVPGGWFLYSTLSKTGPAFRSGPSLRARRHPGEPRVRYAARAAYHLAGSFRRYRADVAKWKAGLARATDRGGWATAPLAAVDFELVHFSTVKAEQAALAESGLEVVRLFADDGRPLDAVAPADASGDAACSWFHVVARKAPARPLSA